MYLHNKTFYVIVLLSFALAFGALARDDGRYANSQLKQWFDSLGSKKGLCCADFDGKAAGSRVG